MTATRPQRVGRFVIEGELGRGEWGEVLAARDERLDRRVALKRLPADFACDPQQRARVEEEARLLAAVNHPNVATLFGLEDGDDGAPHLVMELVPGPTLAERLLEGALTATEALDVGCQLAAGIEAAHLAGVVHGDLKPANVKLTPVGRVKVLDFGIARRSRAPAGGPAETGSPAKGGVSGSPGYIGPEQLAGVAADERTDCWSFGCVLFECLAGVRAVPGETLSEVLTATAHGEPDWSALPDETPEELRTLLRACLSRDPAARPSSLAAVREELDGLGENAPAVAVMTGRLPVPTTSFVGRERELEDLEHLLAESRLVTLTGVGGTGKSRLALEAAQRAQAGSWTVGLVQLAAIQGADHVPSAVLFTLGLAEQPGRPPLETLATALTGRRFLLVLDNCEHVLGEVRLLSEALLSAGRGNALLITSRERVGVADERVVPVPPLSTVVETDSAGIAELTSAGSVQLFLDRAGEAGCAIERSAPRLRQVARLCARLDGLPLAIELAAARLRLLTLDELDERLQDPLQVLGGGSLPLPDRARTMTAALDWSHELLPEQERALYRRLSVFAGQWTIEAVEQVCPGEGLARDEILDVLSRLLDKSLVEVLPASSPRRFHLLELVRQHARNKLSLAGEEEALRRQHCGVFLALAETAQRRLNRADAASWLERLDLDHGNCLAALEYAMEAGDAPSALRLGDALGGFWHLRGHGHVGTATLARLIELDPNAPPDLRARVRGRAGALAARQGDLSRARTLHEEARTLAEEGGDRVAAAESLRSLGVIAGRSGDIDRARQLLEAGTTISEEENDRDGVMSGLASLGVLARMRGKRALARELADRALSIARQLGDRASEAGQLNNLAAVSSEEGDDIEAEALVREALALNRELGNRPWIALNLHNLGIFAEARGDLDAASELLDEALSLRLELGDREGVLSTSYIQSIVARSAGDHARARELLESTLGEARRLGFRSQEALALGDLGIVAWRQSDNARARSLLLEARSLMQELGEVTLLPIVQLHLAKILVEGEDIEGARSALGEVLANAEIAVPVVSAAELWEVFAVIACHDGRPADADALVAAATALRESDETPVGRGELRIQRRDRRMIERASLGKHREPSAGRAAILLADEADSLCRELAGA